jgi:DNA-binding NarL/FixJ family response regulator
MGLPIFCKCADAVPENGLAEEPDIVVVDPIMAGIDVQQLTLSIKETFPFARVVFYTRKSGISPDFVARLIESGADALLDKEKKDSPMLTAFARVLAGGKWLDPSIVAGGDSLSPGLA